MKLLIGGGVCHANVNDLFEIGDAEVLFGDVIKAFHAADRVVINFECANADGGDMDILAEKYTHNERFAHYLHCEAHQDVWRELYRLPWEMRDLD